MANQYTNPWTTEEDDKLLSLYSQFKSNEFIAKELGRTPYAIMRRLERLGASKHAETGTISANQLAKALNVDSKTITTHIKKKNLPAFKFRITKERKADNSPYYIQIERFWKWAENNKDLYNWTRYERKSLLPEPDWLDEAIEQSKKIPKNRRKPWTSNEDKKLWHLYYEKGMLQKDIAKIMGRSVNGIERRLNRLRDKKLNKV